MHSCISCYKYVSIYKQAAPHIPTSLSSGFTYLGNYSSEEPIQYNMDLEGG